MALTREGRSPARIDLRAIGLLGIGVCMVLAVRVAVGSWERVKLKPPDRAIEVTGSAKKRIISDLIEWSASIETEDPDRTTAYRALASNVDATMKYLLEQGVKKEEIRVSSVHVSELVETVYEGSGYDRVTK